MTESMAWIGIDGVVTDVMSPRQIRVQPTNGGSIVVSIANVGERATAEATERLAQLTHNRPVSVAINPSSRDAAEVAGEVHVNGVDVARQMLREGVVSFAPAEPYTLSRYSECLHRIAEREAQSQHVGLWAISSPD